MSTYWRPINTAPKDGTHILVAYAKREVFGDGRIWAEVVKWDNNYCGWSDDDTEYIMSDAIFTHWAPIPPIDEKQAIAEERERCAQQAERLGLHEFAYCLRNYPE